MSGRANGKRTQRHPVVDVKPGTPEGDAIGLSDRQQGQASPRIAGQGSPIPGGRQHLGNHATVPQQVPIPEPRDTYRGIMAHGVAPEFHDAHERSDAERGPNDVKSPAPHPAKHKSEPLVPVPVYIVSQRGGPRPLKTAIPRHVTVPGFNADPVCICGVDFNRTKIRLMNNDASNPIRIAADPTALILDPASATSRTIGGALLPKGMVSYQDFETQNELWAVTAHATATVELQIIMETSVAGAGGTV